MAKLKLATLSDLDRTAHLAKLYSDLISRLRLAEDARLPISVAAAAHGQIRHGQGYSASMLVEESRVLQVATFSTLHLHRRVADILEREVEPMTKEWLKRVNLIPELTDIPLNSIIVRCFQT